MASSFSIEETNKIRVSVGLPPLPVPGAGPTFKESADSDSDDSDASEQASTLETREAASFTNWKRIQDDAEAKKKRDARNATIRKERDAAQKVTKLEGKGLGDVEDEIDTKTWLLGQKKRQRKLERERTRKTEEEQAERDRMAEHTAEDLAGVKVGHEMGDFEDGEQVLTLKDTTIDENEEEGDELENLDLKERERLKEKMDSKKKKPVYDPNSVDEEGKSTVLAQYDEEIDGKKRKRFTLDGQGAVADEREAKRRDVSARLKSMPISLDILQDVPKSDYMDVSEVKVKKPKKKKAKSTRQKAADDDDIFPLTEETNGDGTNGEAMEVDTGVQATKPKAPAPEISFVDDEDLQASLAAQRRAVLKKRKKIRPEDIARQFREEASATPHGMDIDAGDGAEEEPGLIIDETSEFVENLQRPVAPEPKRERLDIKPSIEGPTEMASPGDDGDVAMGQAYSGVEDEEELLARLKREQSTSATPDITSTGLQAEATLDQGLAATLNLLKERGLVKGEDSGDINALHRKRQQFLGEKQRREADAERLARTQRERDRVSGKLERMSAREREEHARWENKQRDQHESREMAAIFNREYRPDVQLKYIDDHGRSMNQKEAFKHLSHQFHGKGSGKQKTDKHLKKIEDEKKREAMSTLDSSQSIGLNNAMGATQKKNRQAGVRLG